MKILKFYLDSTFDMSRKKNGSKRSQMLKEMDMAHPKTIPLLGW